MGTQDLTFDCTINLDDPRHRLEGEAVHIMAAQCLIEYVFFSLEGREKKKQKKKNLLLFHT